MKRFVLSFLIIVSFVTETYAAVAFEKAIWIPYWRKTEGASTTLANLDKVTQISPFAFELQKDGTMKNAAVIEKEPWPSLAVEAKKKGIKIYPSILSYPHSEEERYSMYLLVAQKAKRVQHIKDIVILVKKNNFDGIDIDYENKLAESREYFAIFLRDLSTVLHKEKKKLICTVEARTPPDSKYATTSKEILARVEYANDYKTIGKVCDQVRLMTYDQGIDDAQLVLQNTNDMYRPIADIDWVKKVATLALRDIPAHKIILGLATYGYKYEIIPATGTSSIQYKRIGAMNYNTSKELADSLNIIPTRNKAGELSFTYATSTGINGEQLGGTKQYLIWYSDAVAIADKVRIAKLYKLGGVVVFKIDGGFDPKLWEVLK